MILFFISKKASFSSLIFYNGNKFYEIKNLDKIVKIVVINILEIKLKKENIY